MSYDYYNTKIVAYNKAEETGDFSNNIYWGSNYRTEFFLDGRQSRSGFNADIEEFTDSYDRPSRYKNVQTERFIITTLCSQSILNALRTIDQYDIKELHKLDSSGASVEVYDIRNIDIEDEGGSLDLNSKLEISFQMFPTRRPTGDNITFAVSETVGWDITGDGQIDVGPNGLDAPFTGGYNGTFSATQVYQNLRPNSLITLRAITTNPNGTRRNIATFVGKTGDLLSNADLWRSGINMWDYFGALDEIGTGKTITFDKKSFAEDNGYRSTEGLDRSVFLELELSSTRGNSAILNINKVYSIWGSFSSTGVYSDLTGESSIVTVGNDISSNTLLQMQSYRVPLVPAGSPSDALYESFIRVESNNVFSRYSFGTSGNNENYYEGSAITNGNYLTQWRRGTYDTDNFTLSINEGFPIVHTPDVITSPSLFDFEFVWKFDRQTGLGGFPVLGGIDDNNKPKIFLDGQQIAQLAIISSIIISASGIQSVTLSDTDVHEIDIAADTTNGYVIGTRIQVQLKPVY